MQQNSVTQANLIEIQAAAATLSDRIGVEAFDASSSSTVNTSTDTFTIVNHGFTNGMAIVYNKNGSSNSNTAIGGLTNGQTYYVISATTDSFKLSTSLNGSAVNITSVGTGTQMFTTTTDTSLASAADIARIYQQLQSARRLAYTSIEDNAATSFDTVIGLLEPVASAYNSYQYGTGSLTDVQTSINTVNKYETGNLKLLLADFGRKWAIQDRVYYEYSKTGEADLNNQLGQLGDALDTLSHVINITNNIDLALSVQPRNSSGNTLVNSDSNLTSDFYTSGDDDLYVSINTVSATVDATTVSSNTITSTAHGFSSGDRVILNSSGTAPGGTTTGTVYYIKSATTDTFQLSTYSNLSSTVDITSIGSGYISLTKQKNAMQYTYDAAYNLDQLKTAFATGTAVRDSIDAVLAALNGYGVLTSSNWNTAADPASTSGSGIWNTTFRNFWQDTTLRRKVNDLQTNLSSQNDVEKQNLRKAMFIYQEFIKSAGTVMDRVYDAIKGIASRIGR